MSIAARTFAFMLATALFTHQLVLSQGRTNKEALLPSIGWDSLESALYFSPISGRIDVWGPYLVTLEIDVTGYPLQLSFDNEFLPPGFQNGGSSLIDSLLTQHIRNVLTSVRWFPAHGKHYGTARRIDVGILYQGANASVSSDNRRTTREVRNNVGRALYPLLIK